MSRFIIIIVISFLLVGCKCFNQEIVNPTITNNYSSDKVEGFLPETTYKVLNSIGQISYFKVAQKLIEGTDNEYSNKSLFIRDVSEAELIQLVHLLKNDDSYQWANYSEKNNFEVANQFVCKSEQGQFNLLTNKDNTLVSFISLDGQSVIPVHENFSKYLNNLTR